MKRLFFINTLQCLWWDYNIEFEKWQWKQGNDDHGRQSFLYRSQCEDLLMGRCILPWKQLLAGLIGRVSSRVTVLQQLTSCSLSGDWLRAETWFHSVCHLILFFVFVISQKFWTWELLNNSPFQLLLAYQSEVKWKGLNTT